MVTNATAGEVAGESADPWSLEVKLWWRDFDYLGHCTAASYGSIYEEAFGAFAIEAWSTDHPEYVVSRFSIDFRHEILPKHGRLTVTVTVTRIGRSSVEALLVIRDSTGRICSTAANLYVAWDGERRCSRPMTPAETEGLRPFLAS